MAPRKTRKKGSAAAGNKAKGSSKTGIKSKPEVDPKVKVNAKSGSAAVSRRTRAAGDKGKDDEDVVVVVDDGLKRVRSESERLWRHVCKKDFVFPLMMFVPNMCDVLYGPGAGEAVAAAAAAGETSESGKTKTKTKSGRAAADAMKSAVPVDKNQLLYEFGKDHLVVPIVFKRKGEENQFPRPDDSVHDFLLDPDGTRGVGTSYAEWQFLTFLASLLEQVLKVIQERVEAADDEETDAEERRLRSWEKREAERKEREKKERKLNVIRWFNERFSPYSEAGGPARDEYRDEFFESVIAGAKRLLKRMGEPRTEDDDQAPIVQVQNAPHKTSEKLSRYLLSLDEGEARSYGDKNMVPEVVLVFEGAEELARRVYPRGQRKERASGFVALRGRLLELVYNRVFGLFVGEGGGGGVVWMEKMPSDYKVDRSMRFLPSWYADIPPFVVG